MKTHSKIIMTFENFQKFVDETTEGFEWGDAENIEFLKNIVNYFGGGETKLDKSKGLLIRGGVGVGKTSILRLIQKWLPRDQKFAYNPCNQVVGEFNANGELGIKDFKQKRDRLFDDLGAEDKGMHFGNKVETMEKVILARYDYLKSTGMITHFTTNLVNEEINEKYGKRAYDRLREMCQLINWNAATSKRGGEVFKYKRVDNGPKEPTEEDLKQIRKTYIEECFLKPYNNIRLGERNTFDSLVALRFFKEFYSKGIIKLTEEEKKEYKEKALDHVKVLAMADQDFRRARKTRAVIDLYEEGEDRPEIEQKIKEKAAELYFIDYIKKMIAANIDINDFLKFNKFYEV